MKAALLLLAALTLTQPVWARQNESPRGLFVSMIEEPPVLSSSDQIKELVRFSKEARIRTLFVQVYRANQSWFPSKVADDSFYQEALQRNGKDPLAELIQEAHASGIQVHGWLNLLSLSQNENAPLLKKYGPSILTRNQEPKDSLKSYRVDEQYFLEPGDSRVRTALCQVVGELVARYPELDGIQFDYIRYPDTHPDYGYGEANAGRFLKETRLKKIEKENPIWQQWKRDQVTGLLKLLIRKARAIEPKLQVSTTGLMPYSRANLEAFQDWKSWIRNGTIDFVTLMCYSVDETQFTKYIQDAKRQFKNLKKVNIAVGAYSFLGAPRDFQRQFEIAEDSHSRSAVVFYYGSLTQSADLKKGLK